MEHDKIAPIACTLSPADFKERAQWLKEMTGRALIGWKDLPHGILLSYRRDTILDVEKLVWQEQSCCGFLDFKIYPKPDSVELAITTKKDLGPDARLLFAHLLPDNALMPQCAGSENKETTAMTTCSCS